MPTVSRHDRRIGIDEGPADSHTSMRVPIRLSLAHMTGRLISGHLVLVLERQRLVLMGKRLVQPQVPEERQPLAGQPHAKPMQVHGHLVFRRASRTSSLHLRLGKRRMTWRVASLCCLVHRYVGHNRSVSGPVTRFSLRC